MIRKYARLVSVLVLTLTLTIMFVNAQSDDNIYVMERDTLTSTFFVNLDDSLEDEGLIYIYGLKRNDTISVRASLGENTDLVPRVLVVDGDIERILAENASDVAIEDMALDYTIELSGTHVIGVYATEGSGTLNVTITVNGGIEIDEPDTTVPDSETIIIGETTIVDTVGEIRSFNGTFVDDDDEILIEVVDVSAGDTIYAYAAGIGLVDTYMYILDSEMVEVFVEDNNGGGGFNAALSYEAEEDGTYIVGIITRGSPGQFNAFVGINTPEILDVRDVVPSGDIVVDFEPFDCDLAELSDRPEISGRETTREEPTFVVHYALSGRDATTEEWVDELVIALQRSLDTQLNELGWALPPADCGEGGDTRLDVYVMDIEEFFANGIATPENLVGDNPNTPVEEYYAAYSFLRIDNDLSYIEDREEAFNQMRTTAAHEVHHNIQFGYDVNDRFFGFYEAGATWIETLVYPELVDAGADISTLFSTPDACVGSFAGFGSGDFRIYSEWVLIDSFTRDLGVESYQFIWEYMAANEGLEGFYRALEELGTTPATVVERMAIRNLIMDYDLAKSFDSTVRIESIIDGTGLVTSERNGVQQLSVDYLLVEEPDVYTFDLVNGADTLELYAIGIDYDDFSARVYELGAGGTIDTKIHDVVYLMVLNPQQHADSSLCEYTDWMIQVSDGTGETLAQPTDEIWNAINFVYAE
ncbi:MAG: hypothetical protein AAF126_00935 [Chloroflexota bacterium]